MLTFDVPHYNLGSMAWISCLTGMWLRLSTYLLSRAHGSTIVRRTESLRHTSGMGSVFKLVDEISLLTSVLKYLAEDRWLITTDHANLPKLIFNSFLVLIEHHLLHAEYHP